MKNFGAARRYIDPQLVRRAQLRMLEILETIDDICQRHNLRYFIAYGTLLGVVRHQGFIPWDDDCDIFMPRADYEKFAELSNAELPANMFLQSRETEPQYRGKIHKVRLRDTKAVEFDEGDDAPYCQGIFVDIFIGDFYPSFCLPLVSLLEVNWNRRRYAKGSLKRILYNVVIAIPSGVIGMLKKLFAQTCRLWRKNERLPYLGQEATICCRRGVNPAKFWLPPKRDIAFEGHYFSVPNNSDALLKIWFGDYMTPPPLENRHTHFKAIVKV